MQKRLGLDLEVADEFGWMMGGYTVAEAHFLARIEQDPRGGYRSLRVGYQIGVRDDDRPALEYIRETLGIGHIYPKSTQGKAKPAVIYQIHRIADLYHVIIPLFEKYPLPKQWRKAKEFKVWKALVALQYLSTRSSRGKGSGRFAHPQSFWDKVIPLAEELKRIRAYSPP